MKTIRIFIASIILIMILLIYGIYCSRNGIIPSSWVGWGLICLIITSILSFLELLVRHNNKKKSENHVSKTLNTVYYVNYQESLKNNDGDASYWGELYYYDLYEPKNIFQQNQIQLKIQNDILSHLKTK